MKLKLISDGTIEGTKLINKDTGETLENVSFIRFSADANDNLTFLDLKLFNIEVEINSPQTKIIESKYNKFADCFEANFCQKQDVKIDSSDGSIHHTVIKDTKSNIPIGAVQKVAWSVDTFSSITEGVIEKIKI